MQSNVNSRSLLSVILMCSLLVHSLALADDQSQDKNWQTELAHRLYPLAGMALASACMKANAGMRLESRRWVDDTDNSRIEACKALFLASTFALGNEIATAFVDFNLIESGNLAHAAAALPLLAYGRYEFGSNPIAAIPYVASGMNQLGRVARRVISQNAEAINNFAKRIEFPEQHMGHALEVAKTTAAVTGLGTAVLLFSGSKPTKSFVASMAASSAFTLTYMARESLLEHAKHISSYLPEFQVAGALSVVGAIGLAYSTAFSLPFIASLALLEAGVFSAAENSIAQASQAGVNTQLLQAIAMATGGFLYIRGDDVTSTYSRIQRQVGQALMLPAAFWFGMDFLKVWASHWRFHQESQA